MDCKKGFRPTQGGGVIFFWISVLGIVDRGFWKAIQYRIGAVVARGGAIDHGSLFIHGAPIDYGSQVAQGAPVDLDDPIDYGALVDHLLEQTRAKIPDSVAYTQLHNEQKLWNKSSEQFDVLTLLQGVNGHLQLGSFRRDGTPSLRVATNDQILESKFILDLSITYDNFTADNFTSGEEAHGQMTITYDKAEIVTRISIKKTSNTCTSSLQSFLPVTFSEPTVTFSSSSTNLPQQLFSNAKFTVNFYLNQTLMTEGLPTFATVVAESNLCSTLY
ncbi:hypothetical protein GE061_004829 [Apolygus lucorum]|uniref:Uncharacterized protein n=1 Tax=Apolygus lucorum TaxID=248454 RepID=A0A8S9WZT4_APOLU|nr:hypothetical protein GE061_004829 [Apolygus lucorum]